MDQLTRQLGRQLPMPLLPHLQPHSNSAQDLLSVPAARRRCRPPAAARTVRRTWGCAATDDRS